MKHKSRITIPEQGKVMDFYSKNGSLLAIGYNRIVFGKRGPYVEFEKKHIICNSFYMPDNVKYRCRDGRVFYLEYRSKDESFVKLYFQLKKVSYADYLIGKYYISPSDLYVDGKCIVNDMRKEADINGFI